MVEDLPNPKIDFYVLQFFTFDTDSFHKQELQIYLEYGLQDYLNLILKSPHNRQRQQGFSDQVRLRWRFNRDPAWATAIQGTLILPLGYEDQDPSGGNQVVGVELSLPVSGLPSRPTTIWLW